MEKVKLVELGSEHFACVYKLEFPDGKVYVGKSKDIGKRVEIYRRKTDGRWSEGVGTALYGAIRLCGLENVLCEVLFRVGGVSGVDWEKDLDYALGIVEMRWIRELGSNDVAVGYNATVGGEMFGVKEMQRVREVEVVKKRVVYKDVEVARERQSNGVPVVGYDIEGRYIGEWPSKMAFTRDMVGGKSAMDFGEWRKGFIIYEKREPVEQKVESYAEYIERTRRAAMEAKRVLEERVGRIKTEREVRLRRGVVMCGKDYKEQCRFANIRDAADGSGLSYSGIYAVLKKGRGTVSGYHFYWSDEWDANGGKPVFVTIERKKAAKHSTLGGLIQLDNEYNMVAEYKDIHEAVEKTGNSYSCIYAAAKKGGAALAGNCHWRFAADYEKEIRNNVDLSDNI